jgi:hypothetical protein
MGIVNSIIRRIFTGTFRKRECTHLDQIQVTTPTVFVCEDCITLGDTWPELRMCMTCGYVGCCDTSKNKHAMKHFRSTGHPLIRPVDQGIFFRWMWCYVDQALLDLPPQG